MEFYESNDYREILKAELARRCQQNPSYSQGAFARDISLRPSRLSEVLNGKQGLSGSIADEIADKLGLTGRELRHFRDLVLSEHGRSKTAREIARLRVKKRKIRHNYNQLKDETLRVISDWHHLAIMELTKLEKSGFSEHWVARLLHLSPAQARKALESLLSQDFLEITGNKLVSTNSDCVMVDHSLGKSRKYQLKILDKIKEAINHDSNSSVKMQTYLLSIHPEKRQLFNSMVEDFAKSVAEKLAREEESQDHDHEIYCFSTQLFQVEPQAAKPASKPKNSSGKSKS